MNPMDDEEKKKYLAYLARRIKMCLADGSTQHGVLVFANEDGSNIQVCAVNAENDVVAEILAATVSHMIPPEPNKQPTIQ